MKRTFRIGATSAIIAIIVLAIILETLLMITHTRHTSTDATLDLASFVIGQGTVFAVALFWKGRDA